MPIYWTDRLQNRSLREKGYRAPEPRWSVSSAVVVGVIAGIGVYFLLGWLA